MTEATDSMFIVMVLLILTPIVVVVVLVSGVFSSGKNKDSKNAGKIK